LNMNKIFIITLLLTCLVLSEPVHQKFLRFIREHDKQYKSDAEFVSRFDVFKNNLKIINQKNIKNTGATFAVNKFADLTSAEFKELYLLKNLPAYPTNLPVAEVNMTVAAPTQWDWRTKNAVTQVKDQGQCGSCWAFSATENIESVHILAGKMRSTLSPQQIVDCDKTCYGCGGGWPYLAFQYVVSAGGLDTLSSYPYTAQDGTCAFNPANVGAKITGYKSISSDESVIQNALTTTSPFSVCVDASSWQFYNGGVMPASECGTSVDHCVQMVGYDTTQSTPYWIIRNSWGSSWGVSGYIYLEMFKDACLIADYVTTAISN